MNLFLAILSALLLGAMLMPAIRSYWSPPRTDEINEASTAGTHDRGMVPFVAEADFTLRHLLAKKGSAANGIVLGTADAAPWGTCVDEPATGDGATVAVFGAVKGTQKVRASAAITAGVEVVAAAAGKVQALPVGAGTYYKVGRTITAAGADGDLIEIVPCYPVAVVVS